MGAEPFDDDSELDVDVEDPQLQEPQRYLVWLYNDNYTSMEFVLEVLTRIFKKSQDEATQLMLKVHTTGRAVAGSYVEEIAVMKVHQVLSLAKAQGFPLMCTAEAAS